MARRSIWKGVVSFGMVAIPVKLYTATDDKDIAFVTLHKLCNTRINQKRFCATHGTEVPPEETVRAYEYSKDQYVVMEPGDFDNLPVASMHTIEIQRFVNMGDIDPINFERTYMLEPDGVGTKPFYLLKQALENSKKAAVAKLSLRQKEHICCLKPYGHAIALHTMFYPDEIRGTAELTLPEEQTAINKPEMDMAKMLISSLSGPYDPSEYKDEYRMALERVIENKLGSKQAVISPPAQAKGKVGDLMEALRQSIAAAQTKQETKAEPAAPEAGAEKAPTKAKAKKKTTVES